MLKKWRGRAPWCCLVLLNALAIPAHARGTRPFLRHVAVARSDAFRLPASRHASRACDQHRVAHLRVRDGTRLPEHLGAERKRREVPRRRSKRPAAARSDRPRSTPSRTCRAKTIYWTSSRPRSTWRCTTRSRASGACTPSRPPCPITAVSWIRGSSISTTRSASSTFGRPAIAQNGTHLIYDLKGARVVLSEAPKSPGFLDPTFGASILGHHTTGEMADVGRDGHQVGIRWRAPAAVDRARRLRHAGIVPQARLEERAARGPFRRVLRRRRPAVAA